MIIHTCNSSTLESEAGGLLWVLGQSKWHSEFHAKHKTKIWVLHASRLPQWVRVLATKPGDLSSIPGTHMTERENWLLHVVLCPTQIKRMQMHTETNKCNKNSKSNWKVQEQEHKKCKSSKKKVKLDIIMQTCNLGRRAASSKPAWAI